MALGGTGDGEGVLISAVKGSEWSALRHSPPLPTRKESQGLSQYIILEIQKGYIIF
jgi:hypothetical protein